MSVIAGMLHLDAAAGIAHSLHRHELGETMFAVCSSVTWLIGLTAALLLLLQLTLPTRSTNMSFIKLTNQNGVKPQKVYEVRTHTAALVERSSQIAYKQKLLSLVAGMSMDEKGNS
jgi:hypothetical protein